MSADVRRRRRTVEERIGAQLRHSKPGDLQGRGEPLKRDRGAVVSRAGGPLGGGPGTVIEHLTAYATAGQTIAAGSGQLMFDRAAGPPTERRGFRTFSARLAADGEVGDIPIDLTGVLLVHMWLKLANEHEITVSGRITRNEGNLLPVTGSSGTGDTVDEFYPSILTEAGDTFGALLDYTAAGALWGSSAVLWGDPDVLWGDGILAIEEGWIDLTLFAEQRATSPAARAWIKVSSIDAYSIVHFAGYWWATEGDVGETVTRYDDNWQTTGLSFEADTGGEVRGIGADGTDLWVVGNTLGADEPAPGAEGVKRFDTSGVQQGWFEIDLGGGATGRAVTWDGTHLRIGDDNGVLARYSTAGVKQDQTDIGDIESDAAFHDGTIVVRTGATGLDVLDASTFATEQTIDTSDIGAAPTGVFVTDDGTVYAAVDGVGVFRWVGGSL